MSADINELLTRLLKTMKLQDIKPMSLHSDRLGDMPGPNSEIKLEWKQAFANGDPVANGDMRIFRPRYEVNVSHQGAALFRQVCIIIVAFQVTDVATFEELWVDEELRKVFLDKQIQKTMWPFIRQYAHDGMSRLGMAPIPLPWIV